MTAQRSQENTWKNKNSKKKSIQQQRGKAAPVKPTINHRFIRRASDTPTRRHRPNMAVQKESVWKSLLHRFNRRLKDMHRSIQRTIFQKLLFEGTRASLQHRFNRRCHRHKVYLPENLFWGIKTSFFTGLTEAWSEYASVQWCKPAQCQNFNGYYLASVWPV